MEMLKSRIYSKISYYLVAALLASFLISLALLQLFAALLFIIWLFEKDKLKSADLFLYVILGFGLIRLVSILFSEYFSVSLVAIQKELLFYTTILALFFYIKTFERQQITKQLEIMIHAGAVVALIGIILFSLGTSHRAQSFGSGYATFSTYLTVILMFILSFHTNYKFKRGTLVWIFETGLIFSGIILAMGRADLAIAVTLGIVIIFLRKIALKKIVPAAVIAFVLTIVALQFNPGESAGRISNPTTLSDRDVLYKGFFELASEHPILGFGPRTFHEIFPFKDKLADKKVGTWHNDYIQTYLESGIFALVLLLLLIFLFFHKSKWIILKPRELMKIDNDKFALIFGTIALLLSGLTGVFLYSPILSILFAYFISLFSYFHYIDGYQS